MSGAVPPRNGEQRMRSTAAIVVGCLLWRCWSDCWGGVGLWEHAGVSRCEGHGSKEAGVEVLI
jgi:hypothetical protein